MGLSIKTFLTGKQVYNGSYSTFSIWRGHILRAAEIEVEVKRLPYGFGEYVEVKGNNLYTNATTVECYWDKEPEDALYPLLVHSDTEGIIKDKYIEPLLDRMLELREAFVNDVHTTYGEEGKITGNIMIEHYDNFIEGLSVAAENDEDIVFA